MLVVKSVFDRRTRFVIFVVALLWRLVSGYEAARSDGASFTGNSFELSGGVIEHSSPTLADLDGDDELEILVGTTALNGQTFQRDGPTYLSILESDGGIRVETSVPAPINSAPAVGDLDGDGTLEVVVTLGGDAADANHNGAVQVYTYTAGTLQPRWTFYTQRHSADPDEWTEGIFSSPTLCDVDADGDLEVAFGSWDQRIYLLDHDGNPIWDHPLFDDPAKPGPGFYNGDTVWSTAACADLNRDGDKEIIIGADIAKGGVLPDGTVPNDGGYLYVFDKDGTLLVRRYLTEALYSSPAVGDLDGDGDLEIVIGTSYTFWQRHPPNPQPYVYAFDTSRVFGARSYSDPAKLPHMPGWPKTTVYPGFSSPALADLDGNGTLEVIIGSGKPNGISGEGACTEGASDPDCYGALYAWDYKGTLVTGFPVWPKDYLDKNSFIRSSPTVADVDNDGELEILFSMLWDVIVVRANGTQEYNLHTDFTVVGSPAVGDTDGDGYVEVWIGGSSKVSDAEVWIGGSKESDAEHGYLWRFTSDVSGVGEAPWPMYHRDAQNSGYYPLAPRLEVAPESLYVLHDYGSGSFENRALSLENTGDGELSWEVQSHPADVSVDPLQGEVDWAGFTLPVTVSVSGYTTGTYDLGSIVITGTVAGEGEVIGSPATIPVTLYVGEVHRVYLPLTLRGLD